MSKPVVILGCGPAGLFAAQAVSQMGGQPLIFSKKKKSVIYGAQFLHQPIPGLSNITPDGWIHIVKFGEEANYAQRVYGNRSEKTSWQVMQSGGLAWSLRKAYDAAWEKFEPMIIDQEINAADIPDMTSRFPLVISTIPRWAICENFSDHSFKSVNIIVCKKAVEFPIGDNYVVYNGMTKGHWYRTSKIFGHESTEATAHPVEYDKEFGKWESGFKVAGTNCDCHPNLIKAGRLGKWERGVLTHHAFESAVEAYTEALAV